MQVNKTVLYISCYEGLNEIVQVLLDAGMKVNVPDKVSIILVYKSSPWDHYFHEKKGPRTTLPCKIGLTLKKWPPHGHKLNFNPQTKIFDHIS